MSKRKLHGMVIVTYRCNAHCNMCNQHLHVAEAVAKKQEELSLETIKKLPEMAFCNITGGEPFIRQDIKDIIRILYTKADRIVIVTNGFFTDRILDVCKEFPQIGIRISMEGLQETNDKIRGIPDGFNRGMTTLRKLHDMGHPDVGFSTTVQDMNCHDLVPLYELGDELGFEHATSTLHNSFYFRKLDNKIDNKYEVAKCFEELINRMLQSKSPKKWFRAYFNHGLINYIYNQPRLLPCEMSSDAFFIEPYGDVITGFLFTPQDINELASILKLVDAFGAEEAKKFCEATYDWVTEMFDPEKFYSRLIAVYEQLIQEKKALRG